MNAPIAGGLMSMFLVVRHTRAEEESGRDEMLRAAAVGRRATTTATVLLAVVANVATGLLVALSLVSVPLAVPDSIGLGAGQAAVGLLFAGVALLAAQLTNGPRAAYGLTGAVIGTAFVLRAIGDIGTPLLTWLSPIGWFQAMHAFSGLRWWPLGLIVLAAAGLCTVAFWTFGRRDHGAGVLATRPGPARGGVRLTTAFGLAWRLQRGALIGWTFGLFVTGLSYGSLGSEVGDLLGDSSTTKDMFSRGGGADITAGFYATSILMLALMSCGYAISTALRPRQEEASGLVEVLLATGLSRARWLGVHVGLTVLGTVAVASAAGLGLGIAYAIAAGDLGTGMSYVVATLPYAAPVLVMSALARLLYGLAPRLAPLAWVALVFAIVVMLFGALLRIPSWVQDVSPFTHLALVPVEAFRWQPWLALLLVAAATSALGQALFRRRDVEVR